MNLKSSEAVTAPVEHGDGDEQFSDAEMENYAHSHILLCLSAVGGIAFDIWLQISPRNIQHSYALTRLAILAIQEKLPNEPQEKLARPTSKCLIWDRFTINAFKGLQLPCHVI